jgi:hypothetical protein
MDLDLVGYLFGLLDPEDRARTAAALAADPAARASLERLRVNLAPLAVARTDEGPPAGLADRTVALIAARRSSSASEDRVEILAGARARIGIASDREPVFAPSRWGRMDVLIASSILVLVGGLGVSGIGRVQREHARTTCQNNLRQISNGLTDFSLNHNGRFPQIDDRPPYNVAGAFVPLLKDGGYLPSGLPNCPLVNVAAEPNAGGYAYTLGVREPDGQVDGLRRSDGDLQPILADQPTPVSHGDGHNVLFVGGNVRFCTNPNVGVGGDHIFLNQAGNIAAGLNRHDTVLADADKTP